MPLRVSPKGRAFIIGHEGMVKKAYRCPAGVITIGSGLTAASGVIEPKLGMTITEAENDRLLDLALTRNYLPRVEKAIGSDAAPSQVDGSASFDFNTGAILKASWVKAFKASDDTGVRKGLTAWNKGGGKVLKGLVRRRSEEADIIVSGKYPSWVKAGASVEIPSPPTFATFVVSVTEQEIAEIRTALSGLGYDVGNQVAFITKSAVEAFQRAHDLTVDGKIGRATLATLQREIDARSKAKTPAAFAAVGAGTGGTAAIDPAVIDVTGISGDAIVWLGAGAVAVGAIYGAYLAWSYRDMIAARIYAKLPRVAAFLRSV